MIQVKWYWVLLLLFPCVWQPAQAQTRTVKYGNDFLNIGVGARAFGMGNAYVGVAGDVTAAYWNPAGLVNTPHTGRPEIGLMHAAYFANIAAYNHAGISMPLDKEGQRRLGFTLIRIGVDNIPNTLNLIRDDGSFDYGAVTGFSATDLAVLLSYSWKAGFLPGLSLGTNLKVIYRGAGNFANSWGFGLDLAAQYRRNGLQLGLVLRDATGTFNAWTFNTETFEEAFINTGNEVPQNSVLRTPPSLRLGIAYDFTLATRLKLLVSVDGDMYFDGQRASLVNIGRTTLDPHMGLEFAFLNQDRNPLVFLRGGMYNLQNVKNLDGEDAFGLFPTAGVGVVIKNFQIDYALANIGNLSQNLHSHVVSLQFHLGKNAD